MKIRLILLSLVGVAAYIMLASFNSKMIKETAISKDQSHASAPQRHPGGNSVPGKATTATPIPQQEAKAPAPMEVASEGQKQPEQQSQPAQQKAPESPPVQLAESSVENTEKLQTLQEEITRKDRQISQMIDAQEAIAAKYRTLLAETEAGAAGAEVKDKMLKESTDQVKILTAEKEQTAAELHQAKTGMDQLRQQVAQIKADEAKAKETILKENSERFTALAADREKIAAELNQAKTALDQLRQSFEQTQTASIKAEQLLTEKEAQLKTLQMQVEERIVESNQFKTQLAETVDKLKAAKAELEQVAHKAEELIRLSAEKEQLANSLTDQKASVEFALQEKTDALNKAILTIQSLKQEVAAQPQAVATVQNLLDERNKEFDQLNREAATKIDQLNKQLADLRKYSDQAAKERDQFKTEIETAKKKVDELEAAQTQAQAALAESEQKLAAALESTTALQNQLNTKESALNGAQTQINELAARAISLSDEKLGLASQLEALQADHTALLAMKASFEEQAAALVKAEGKVKDLAALQAKNEELNATLAEKSAALEKAAQQGEELATLQAKYNELAIQAEATAGVVKQLETEKSDLAGQLAAAQAQVQDIDSLKKSLDEKNTALSLSEAKIKELAGVSEQVAALEAKVTAAQAAKQAAEKEAAETEASVKNLNNSLTASTAKVKALESELTTAQARIKELTDKNLLQAQQDLVPNLTQQISTLRDQITQLEANSTQAKKGLADAAATVQAKTEEAQAASKKAQTLQAEKESLQQSLTANQATINDLQKQLESMKVQPVAVPQPAATATPAEKPAADADKDGVSDVADLCPGSPAGAPVNGLGCPSRQGIVLEGVTFKSGTAVLTPVSQKKLDQVATVVNKAPQVKIEVAGYTDNVGDGKRNLNLSIDRAEAVVKYLTGKGVATAQLTAKGYGSDNPVADNATPEGRQKNRRIELRPVAQ
jgi:outer membrane protein OmpA-like peptidoglycan-associated protein